jgi:outer membrane protein TolC
MKYIFVSLLAVFFSAYSIKAQNTLDYFIAQALDNSPLIKENNNLNKVNELEVQRLKAFYTKPKIGLTANYLFAPIISTDNNQTTFEPNSSGAVNYYGYELGATNGGEYQALLNVSQPLFTAEKYKTAAEQVSVETQINDNKTKLTVHDIKKVVADQYILCLQDSRQIADAGIFVNLLADQKDILPKLIQNGIYKQSDLILLNIEAQNLQTQLEKLKANYQRDLLELYTICGMDDTAMVQLKNIELHLGAKVNNSMFTKSFRLDSLKFAAQQQVFELQYKPQVNLFANTGMWAFHPTDIPQRFGLSAGVSLSWNIFDGKQKELNRQKTLILQQNTAFQKDYFEKQNKIRIDKILGEIKSIENQIKSTERQLKNYDILLDAYKKEMAAGEISILDFLTVLKNKATLTGNYNLLLLKKQSLINTYQYWNW